MEWKWFHGPAFSIGWDCAFMAPADLLTNPAYEKTFPMRGMGKLEIVKGDKGQPTLSLTKNILGAFGAASLTSEGVCDRKLFPWLIEASENAAKDWTETWTEATTSIITDGTEAEVADLAARAAQSKALAESLRAPNRVPTPGARR